MHGPADRYRRLILLTWLAVTLVMLAGVDREMCSMLWGAQHDEKLALWPARAAWLGPPQSVWDFQPPGTVFGWLGPELSLLGFRLFGLGNVGLRLPYLAFSAAGLLCFGLTCARLAPGPLGFLVFLFPALNVMSIAVGRTALLENVAVCSLSVILWRWSTDRGAYVRQASWIAFACGSLLLIKPNFVVYAYALHGCLIAVSGVTLRGMLRHAVTCVLSLAAWLGIHALLLAHEGLLDAYAHNLELSLLVHLGARDAETETLLYKVAPGGFAFTAYQMGFWFMAWIVGWDVNHPQGDHPIFGAACVVLPVALALGLVARLVRQRPFERVPDTAWALVAFLVFNWAFASQLFFALKRAYPFFPVVLVLAAMLLKALWDLGRPYRIAVATGLLALHGVRLFFTRDFLEHYGPELYTRHVEESSRTLDEILPDDAVLYAHGLAARFVWMSHHRIFAWDDQLRSNQMIVDEAVAHNATHVLLVDPSTTTADYVGGFHPPRGVRVELVHTFLLSHADSDNPMRTFLVAIHPEPASDANSHAPVGP